LRGGAGWPANPQEKNIDTAAGQPKLGHAN